MASTIYFCFKSEVIVYSVSHSIVVFTYKTIDEKNIIKSYTMEFSVVILNYVFVYLVDVYDIFNFSNFIS